LDRLDDHDDDDHGDRDHLVVPSLVAVLQGEVSEPAPGQIARHGGHVHHSDEDEGVAENERTERLRDEQSGDNAPPGCPGRAGRFDDPGIDGDQVLLDDPGDTEGRATDNGTIIAVVPIRVPTMATVSGPMATRSRRKGIGRTKLTDRLRTANTLEFCSSPPSRAVYRPRPSARPRKPPITSVALTM
jgi:hypothetical protein